MAMRGMRGCVRAALLGLLAATVTVIVSAPPSTAQSAGDGSLDTTFADGGIRRFSPSGGYLVDVAQIAAQPDGKILVLHGDGPEGYLVSRLTPTGRHDTTFGNGGTARISVGEPFQRGSSLAVQPDGRIVIAGSASMSTTAVVRLLPDGTLDHSFGTAGVTTFGSSVAPRLAWHVALAADGAVIVAGQGTALTPIVARLTPSGALDPAFGSGGVATFMDGPAQRANITAVTVQPDGAIIAVGRIADVGSQGLLLMRLAANGTLDAALGGSGVVASTIGGAYGEARAVAVQRDGKMLVAGFVLDSGPTSTVQDFAIVRFLPDGMLDPAFGTGGQVRTTMSGRSSAWSVMVQPDDRIVVGGSRVVGMADDVIAIARYLPDGALDPSFGSGGRAFNDALRGARSMVMLPDLRLVATGVIGLDGRAFGVVRLQNVGSPSYLTPAPHRRVQDTRRTSKPHSGSITRIETGVPAGSTAALVNITMVDAETAGYVTADRCSELQPGPQTRSNGNTAPGRAVANSSVVPIDADGSFCVYVNESVNLVVDVQGSFSTTGSRFTAVPPVRRVDTRHAGPTLDAGTVTRIHTELPAGATAAFVNITTPNSTRPGYVSAGRCDALVAGPQMWSNGNFAPGIDTSNASVVPLGADGSLCVYNSQPVHLVVDVQGYYGPNGAAIKVYAPTRVLDTRDRTAQPLAAETITRVATGGAGSAAALVNLTMTGATESGYITADRCSALVAGPQTRSNGNFVPGQDVANSATVPLDADGSFCIYNFVPVHLVVDVQGLVVT